MKHFLIGLLLSLSLVISAQNSAIQNAVKRLDYDFAIQLINKEKKSPELELMKAKCYKQLSQYKMACQLLEDLVRQENSNLTAMIELADCYQLAGNYQKAKFFSFMALQNSPENKFCQLNYLYATFRLKDWKASIEQANTLLRKDSLPDLFSLIGDSYYQLGQRDSATYYYEKALLTNTQDFNTLGKLSRIYLQDRKFDKLIESTNKYIETDSSNQLINQYNGIGYCLLNNYNKAISRLEGEFERGDSTFLTNFYLGTSYFATNDFVEAYEHLNLAYSKDSTNQNLFYYLGKSAIMSGHQQEGIQILNKGIDNLTPSDSVLFNYNFTISTGYNGLQNVEEEAKALKMCYKYMPENKSLLYRIASAYDWGAKDTESAIVYYRRFLETRSKQGTTNEQGISVSYYIVAEKRLNELLAEIEGKKKKR